MTTITDQEVDQLFHEFCQLPSLKSPINLDDLTLWVQWIIKVEQRYDNETAWDLELSDLYNFIFEVNCCLPWYPDFFRRFQQS